MSNTVLSSANSATIEKAVIRARMAFSQNITKNVDFRKTQLKSLYRFIEDNKESLVSALQKDLRKPPFESFLTEVEYVKSDIRYQLENINDYTKPKRVSKSMAVMFDDAFIINEPYGVVLIISPWNYPVQLALGPLIGAITAGNCAILKPSELSPATSDLLSTLLPKYIDNECYHIINGGPEVSQMLLNEKFDYIFYTGSTQIGKIVHQAAAKNLTPVTLELGGKSPVYFDDSVANKEVAWRRIFWGRFVNCGQTCVAPDYVLCTEKAKQSLLDVGQKIIKEFYGDDSKQSDDYGRIVNERHFQRVSKLISSSSGKVLLGGMTDSAEKYVSPTVLVDVPFDDSVMQEEIFGPILPVITVKDENHAIQLINSRSKPLALYLFSTNQNVIDKFFKETSSGSMCVNDVVFQLSVESLPFGGIGESGMGSYHGKYSFETFSHKKSVLVRGYNPVLEALGSKRYPPYNKFNMTFLNELIKYRRSLLPEHIWTYAAFSIGVLTGWIFFYYDVLNYFKSE